MNTPIAPPDEARAMELYAQFVKLFAFERYVMATLATLSCLTLIGIGVYLILHSSDWKSFCILFGPAGAISYSTSRLLNMFNIGLRIVFGFNAGAGP